MNRLLCIALLAACGDDTTGTLPDAPPSRDDGGTSVGVRLTVTVQGVPTAGARVIFQASARGGAASLSYPKLPIGDFDFMPAATDAYGVRDLETANITGGYPAIRARALRTRLDVVVRGTPGQLSYQQLFAAQE